VPTAFGASDYCGDEPAGIHDRTVTETVVSLWLPLVANSDSETVFEEALEKAKVVIRRNE
jgi:hypothetical protein